MDVDWLPQKHNLYSYIVTFALFPTHGLNFGLKLHLLYSLYVNLDEEDTDLPPYKMDVDWRYQKAPSLAK